MSTEIETMGTVVYHGNCHCGRYRFELAVPKIESAIVCTCNLCRKKGYLWIRIPSPHLERNQFRVVRDDGCLQDYSSSALRDKFCNHCGTGIFGEHLVGALKDQTLLNVRAIQKVNPFNLEDAVIEDSPPTPEKPVATKAQTPEASPAHHTGSCHCGKVRVKLLVPIEGLEVKEDNCSSCVRIAFVGIYPTKSQVLIHGREHTSEYRYGRKYIGIPFCNTCGVNVFNNVHGPPLGIFDKVPPGRRDRAMAAYYKTMELQPLNVRALDGVDLASLSIERSDEGTEGYVLD